MTYSIARTICAAAAFALTACATTPSAGTSRDATSALRAEVEAVNRQMENAFNRGDLMAVSAFYADDALLKGPRGFEVRGRAAIDTFWKSIQNPKSWKLEAFDIGGNRDEAYQYGRSTLVQAGSPNDRTAVTNFVVIWKRGADGKLRIALDFYN